MCSRGEQIDPNIANQQVKNNVVPGRIRAGLISIERIYGWRPPYDDRMTNPARTERSALCDLFLEVGPDAPTLCGEWTTRDLAAHLVVRETRPDAAAGILIPAAARHGERVRLHVAEQPWEKLVDRVRSGPPFWSPTRLPAIDQLANTVEFFVHHEDVRRGDGDITPRTLTPELSKALWGALGRMGRLLVRHAPGGVTFFDSAHGQVEAKKGTPGVTVTGPVGELVLFAYGRQSRTACVVDGPPDLVSATQTASFGI